MTWKEVPGWEGRYEVSEDGRVRSLPHEREGRPGTRVAFKGRELKGWINRDGYRLVGLSEGRKVTGVGVHRLVLSAFVGPCPENTEACHWNGVRTDNRLENLRWGTRSENTYDRIRHGTHPFASRTQCLRGHPFDDENTYRHPNGSRQCRTCRRAAGAARYARRAA